MNATNLNIISNAEFYGLPDRSKDSNGREV